MTIKELIQECEKWEWKRDVFWIRTVVSIQTKSGDQHHFCPLEAVFGSVELGKRALGDTHAGRVMYAADCSHGSPKSDNLRRVLIQRLVK